MNKLEEVRKKIKQWEYDFKAKNDRLPGKEDIKQEKRIYKLYSSYRTLKSQPVKIKSGESSVSVSTINNESYKSPIKNITNGELGPTPQANGKVMSIFDVKMTPPESSPLKDKQSQSFSTFKTPTKRNKNQNNDPFRESNSVSRSLTAQLKEVSESNFPVTPIKFNNNASNALMTPQYLTTSKQDDKQPLSTPIKQTTISFQVSPTPIKPLRFVTKLTEIANEINVYDRDKDKENENEDEDVFSDHSDFSDIENRKYKKKNPKRTTRRWKMKPREEMEVSTTKIKDIHKKIDQIKEQEKSSLTHYLEDESHSESDYESDADEEDITPLKREQQGSTKGKIKPTMETI
ncbi:DNA replication/checkpoint protein [Scheffersomyces amazonensis]|uniref:DNA replication/checkpoint protein n=1 Tax=Scheffersomyces amazonensis TaxID=1078765 RepID=UPI00315CE422